LQGPHRVTVSRQSYKRLTRDNASARIGRAAARTAHRDFFVLWKNADPDIPILKEAKAEYDKLK